MAITPLSQPLQGIKLITFACHLYRISVLATLPLGLAMMAVFLYIRLGALWLPEPLKQYHFQSAAFLGILLFPLMGGIFTKMDEKAKGFARPITAFFVFLADRFLTLMGTFISMILFPAILIGVGVAGFIFLRKFNQPNLVLMSWVVFATILVFGGFVTKLLAPSLVFTDQLDANTAIDTSENLIKDYYIRTFFLSAYAFIFVVFLFMITSGIKMVFPEYYKMLPVMAWEGITVGLVALLGPWSFALMLAQLYDLQLRKTKIITPTAKDKVSAI